MKSDKNYMYIARHVSTLITKKHIFCIALLSVTISLVSIPRLKSEKLEIVMQANDFLIKLNTPFLNYII